MDAVLPVEEEFKLIADCGFVIADLKIRNPKSEIENPKSEI
jgi:hypothetical protein